MASNLEQMNDDNKIKAGTGNSLGFSFPRYLHRPLERYNIIKQPLHAWRPCAAIDIGIIHILSSDKKASHIVVVI